MNIDDKLNSFLFLFSTAAYLYAFFTIKHSINIYGEHISSIPITVIICPFICLMCILKMLKIHKPLATRNDKKMMLNKFRMIFIDKYYEGIEINREWKNRKKYKQ